MHVKRMICLALAHAELPAVVVICTLLAGCPATPTRKEPKTASTAAAPAPTLASLNERLAQLEKEVATVHLDASMRKIGFVSCKGEGFATVETNNGWLLVSCEEASPYLDGFELKMRIGNPSSLTYIGFTLTILHGGTTTKAELSQDLTPGSWTSASVVLAPAKASDLSAVGVEIETNKVSLRRAR
jgi:hypothetical protein